MINCVSNSSVPIRPLTSYQPQAKWSLASFIFYLIINVLESSFVIQVIDKNINIHLTTGNEITLRTSNVGPIFDVLQGKQFSLKNMTIYGGNNANGSALINSGNLTLDNVIIYQSQGNPNLNSSILNQNTGTINVLNNTQVKKEQLDFTEFHKSNKNIKSLLLQLLFYSACRAIAWAFISIPQNRIGVAAETLRTLSCRWLLQLVVKLYLIELCEMPKYS